MSLILTSSGKNRQLVREGQAQKDHRYRPHAISVHHLPTIQERLPDWHPQGRSWPGQAINGLVKSESGRRGGGDSPFLIDDGKMAYCIFFAGV